MNELVDATLSMMDELYPPTAKAVEQREALIAASSAPGTELPYYVSQLSVMMTLMERLAQHKTVSDMRKEVFQASVAFTVAIGLMNSALSITSEEGAVH